jgi:hypothetical protein
MCIIVVQPKKKTISKKRLEACFANNPDGAGYMFSHNRGLVIRKGFFTFDSFYRSYKLDWLDYGKTSYFILHFRIATHGSVDITNCHPHKLSNRLAFVHNGIFRVANTIKAADHKSDTMRAAIIFKQLPADWYYKRGLRILVEEFFNSCNSYGAFMNDVGDIWLTNKADWKQDKKIWFSNDSYMDYPKFPWGDENSNADCSMYDADKTYMGV